MTTSDLYATGRHLQKCHSHRCDCCRQHWGHDAKPCAAPYRTTCPTCADPLKIRVDSGQIIRLTEHVRVRWVGVSTAVVWIGSRQRTVTRQHDRGKLLAWLEEREGGSN